MDQGLNMVGTSRLVPPQLTDSLGGIDNQRRRESVPDVYADGNRR